MNGTTTTDGAPSARKERSDMSLTATDRAAIQAELDAYDAEFRGAWQAIRQARGRTPVRTGWGGDLIVHQRSYGIPADAAGEAAIINGTAEPVEAILTEDGRPGWIGAWHQGEPTGDSIYVERWSPEGRTWHGYVDPTSRLVVQTG